MLGFFMLILILFLFLFNRFPLLSWCLLSLCFGSLWLYFIYRFRLRFRFICLCWSLSLFANHLFCLFLNRCSCIYLIELFLLIFPHFSFISRFFIVLECFILWFLFGSKVFPLLSHSLIHINTK